MKQFLLALALVMAPVAAFTAGEIYLVPHAQSDVSGQSPGLGDLTSLQTIISDVQQKAASGDIAAASARITDFETAWDAAANGMRPLNPTAWAHVDGAADAALHALRAANPDPAKVNTTLKDLLATLRNPSA